MERRRQLGIRSVGVRLAIPALLVLGAAALVHATRGLEAAAESPYPITPTVSWRKWQALPAGVPAAWRTDVVLGEPPPPLAFEQGETLSGVLESLGLSRADAHEVATEVAKHVDLRRLRPQDRYQARYGDTGELRRFELVVDGSGKASVEKGDEGWRGRWRAFERSVKRQTVSGTLEGALESSIERAGGPESLALLMADVFQWDLDFTRDLRLGDSFSVLLESVYLDGSYYSAGSIVAAVYVNEGRRLEAYRFGEDGQYYDAEGRPTRKMFLRSPLRYSRVTSRFSHRRFHPILKRYRPHYGVDYGAPVGTPVRATASGRVVSAAWDGGGGRTVKLRHANGYLTAYLHLSRFASGLAPGRRVQQGDVIGYVGSSGLSTSPHLDYRVQRNGRWIDPLSLRSVPADPIPAERLADFMALRDALRTDLGDQVRFSEPDDRIDTTLLAEARLPAPASATEASEVSR
jgi:murein DD-endopeptidase MepM/ murein hydrolase activator NlpD